MTHIGIVGSGNVGANTAFFAAERNIGNVCLYDVKEGLSTGKALDMMEAAPLRNYQFSLTGTDAIEDALAGSVVILAAGEIRTPGKKRSDLYESNKPTVIDIAKKMKGYKGVVLIVTEPVDRLTSDFVDASGIASERVVGLGGHLDVLRLRYAIARELGTDVADVAATVIGSHSSDMLPLLDYCNVSGVPLAKLLPHDRIAELFEQTLHAGDEIVELAKRSNSYYGPAAAAVDVAEAVVRDTNRVLSLSTVLNGQYGISGVALSLPVMLGAAGIKKVLEPKLNVHELEVIKATAEILSASN
ncbi:MAG: malate dehydrogenase [Spirochaetales bacterium]